LRGKGHVGEGKRGKRGEGRVDVKEEGKRKKKKKKMRSGSVRGVKGEERGKCEKKV